MKVKCNTFRKTECQVSVVAALQFSFQPTVNSLRFSFSVQNAYARWSNQWQQSSVFLANQTQNQNQSSNFPRLPPSLFLMRILIGSIAWFNAVFVFQVRLIGNAFYDWRNSSADLLVCCFLMLNFIADPFMYVLTRKQYRQVLKMIFTCRCKGRLDDRVFPLNAQR